MPATQYDGTPPALSINFPAIKLGGGTGGKGRPSEGKMFPRGKP